MFDVNCVNCDFFVIINENNKKKIIVTENILNGFSFIYK